MGYGRYSHDAHQALLRTRADATPEAVFRQTGCHPLMNPKGIRVRESRDSDAHPRSLGIAFALDVTGSMGAIPRGLATQTLPQFVKVLESAGVADPQVLFLAVGDATSDRAPLQVGQFESTAELMDQWLTWSFLEGGGGGQGMESYELAMYLLAEHTEMDCRVKRGERGFLFLTGDERPYPVLSRHVVEGVLGDRLDEDLPVEAVVALLQQSYHPFFLIPEPGRRARCEPRWRELLGDHVLCLAGPQDVSAVAAGAILLTRGTVSGPDALRHALETAGVPPDRLPGVVRALEPLIEA